MSYEDDYHHPHLALLLLPPPTVDELTQALQNAEEMRSDPSKPDPRYTEASLEVLNNWLNFHVMTTRITKFPQDMITSNGRLAVEAVELMSGKPFSNKVRERKRGGGEVCRIYRMERQS